MTDREQDSGLNSLFNDFDREVGAKASAPKTQTRPAGGFPKGQVYRSALDERETGRLDIARATGKKASVAGRYLRRSFTYRPEQLEVIERIAEQLSLSQNDLVRWFTDLGIDAVARGERPLVTEEIRRKYDPGSE